MTEVAGLSVPIDASVEPLKRSVAQAETMFSKIAQAADRAASDTASTMNKVAAATAKQTEAAEKAAAALEARTNPALAKAKAAWFALERQIAGTPAAMERFTLMSQQADAALEKGRINAAQHAQAVARLKEQYLGVSPTLTRLSNDSTAATSSAGKLRGALGQVGFQAQDAAVQLQMGTNALVVFGQQGSQLAGAFGPTGAIIGSVIAVTAALGSALLGASAASAKSAKDIDSFGDTLTMFEGRVRESGGSLDSFADKFRGLNDEIRALAELTLRTDIDTLNKKLAKGVQSEWGAFVATAGTEPAGVEAIRKLFMDNNVTEFLQRLQAINSAGAMRLMADEDVRQMIQTGEAIRVAEARLAELENRATPAQKALLGLGEAMQEAAKAASTLATEQARAGASLFMDERGLDAKIAALKGGEAAMKAYSEEQVRSAAYSKAYDAAIKAGETALDAHAEGLRLAAKAAEAYRLEQDRAAQTKADNKSERQAEQDAKAYAKVVAELDRDIAAQERLAGIVGLGAAAQNEANTQTRIAAELAKAHVEAGTAEAEVIERKVRAAEQWKATGAQNSALKAAEEQLRFAKAELALAGESESVRVRALHGLETQREAVRLFGDDTSEAARRWIELQNEIFDTSEATKTLNTASGELWRSLDSAEDLPEDVANNPAVIALFMEALQ